LSAASIYSEVPPDLSIDLTECEREPICHLGLIQPHGYLLAIDSAAEITHASENIGQLFSISASDALGRPLGDVLGLRAGELLRQAACDLPGQIQHEIWERDLERYSLWTHKRGSKYILEWELLAGVERAAQAETEKALSAGLAQLCGATSIPRQATLGAELAARVTGFDRVMVYQFEPDWSGEVIADVRHSWAEPFLGLRYPASDIPPQARKLYTETLLRVLVDVWSTPIGILSQPRESAPLDLTLSQLRALSPYHIQYLKNMKVGASATASILCDGVLWGMLACHHDRHKVVSPAEKKALMEIARTLSASVENAVARARHRSVQRLNARLNTLEATIDSPAIALSAILFGPERLRNSLHGCGTAVWSATGSSRMGETPSLQELGVCASRLLSGGEDVVAVDTRADLIARLGVAPQDSAPVGLIAIVVSRQPALILFSFRLEAIRQVTWGGDINEPVLRDEQTGALCPRRSFAQYKQSILGKATPWTEEDLATAHIFLRVLRGKASTPEQMAQLIEAGFAGIRRLATDDHPLHSTLLDALGDGVSLVFRSGSGETRLRSANQSLLDLAETCAEADAPLPSIHDLLAAMGLPANLLAQCEVLPQQVVIPIGREGPRHFLVEKKLALEISDSRGTEGLSALLFSDITRVERARQAFQAAEERAKHLTFLKTSFLANMSHEIRTPLNGILGMAQLLQNTSKDAQQQEYVNVIQRSGDVMLKIINDLLDVSKIEAGRVDLEIAPFNLTSLIEGVVDLLRPQALEKSITISAAYDSPPPRWYSGDAFRLRQVILNIAGNAVKFTSVGQVSIRVHCGKAPQQPTGIMVEVSDTGIGIPTEQLPFMFDKFHQVDPSTTRKYGGTGLGLAISRELTELMGGTISLTSTTGVGSTFMVSLPLTRSSDPAPARATDDLLAASSAHPITLGVSGIGRRILVAEDDLTNQIVIEGMLKTQGFEVDIAPSGLVALELLESRRYDLILMDCHMPDLDGYRTTERIRAQEGTARHIPIVALTASALPEDRQRCLEAGMDDYMAKPIHMARLFEILRKMELSYTPQASPSTPRN
jgi:light-regulated signal transduction histidine kinase (bacteriophytochrome)/ActR/RegA family two-component response regulator